MKHYFPTSRGWVAFLLAAFSAFFFPFIGPAIYVESNVGNFLATPATATVRVFGALRVIISSLASVEAFRRGSWADKIVAAIAVLLILNMLLVLLDWFVLPVYQPKP